MSTLKKKKSMQSRQQQEHDSILLRQTPTWLASTSVVAAPEGLHSVASSSALLGASSPLSHSSKVAAFEVSRPSLARRFAAGAYGGHAGTPSPGPRMAAESPFPVARTPPPRLTPLDASPSSIASPEPSTMMASTSGKTSPYSSAKLGHARAKGEKATSPAKAEPEASLQVVGGSDVTYGTAPSKQGLHAIVSVGKPKRQGAPATHLSTSAMSKRRKLPPAGPGMEVSVRSGSPKSQAARPPSVARSIATPGGSAVDLLLRTTSAGSPPSAGTGIGWDGNATFYLAPRTPGTAGSMMRFPQTPLAVVPGSAGALPGSAGPSPITAAGMDDTDFLASTNNATQVKFTVVDTNADSPRARSPNALSSGFFVPDLSDMDPFTLHERGLVEEVNRMRIDQANYVDNVIAPRILVALPALPPVQSPPKGHDEPHGFGDQAPTPMKHLAGHLHPALVPRCFATIAAKARAVERARRQHADELAQIVQREESSFGAYIPRCELLGGYHLPANQYGAPSGGRRGSTTGGPAAASSGPDRLLVSLDDAEAFVHELAAAIENAKSTHKAAANEEATIAAAAGKAKKGKQPEPLVSPSSAAKPSQQHRRIAAEVLQRLHDESAAVVHEKLAHLRAAKAMANDPADDGAAAGAGRSASAEPQDGDGSADDQSATPDQDHSEYHAGASYVKGLCMAARDLASLLSHAASVGAIDLGDGSKSTSAYRPVTLTTVEVLAGQYGKVLEPVHAYVVYGLWHQPETAIGDILLRWLDNRCVSHPSSVPTVQRTPVHIGMSNDPVLLNRSKLFAGAGWQRHSTKGAVTVLLLSTGYQEVSYIKQHRNLPVVELRRAFNMGQMSKDERVYSLTFIPEHYGIKPVHPIVHPVVCGRRVEIVVDLPNQVLLSCSLEGGGGGGAPSRSQNTTFIDRTGRRARIHVILYEAAPSRVVVYARHPSDLNYRRTSTVLLRPDAAMWAREEEEAGAADAMGSTGGGRPPSGSVTDSPGQRRRSRLGSRRRSKSPRPAAQSTDGHRNVAVADDTEPLTTYPEQFEWFQARLGNLLSPRCGELVDAVTSAQDSPALEVAEADAATFLPPGVQLGQSARTALHGGGTTFSFRASPEAREAAITGEHGSTQLKRVSCWQHNGRYELRARAGGSSSPDASWFFGVAKVKTGAPVTLWLDGQCALQWSVAGQT